MTPKRHAALIFAVLALFLAALCSCTDADDVIFNGDDTEYISVQAYITRVLDSSATMMKSDTITPGDSLIFMTNVYPSKSIRSKDYYWTIDDRAFAGEYNFRRPVYSPGRHLIKFILVDFFGDTLTDSINLIVASTPKLDDQAFIPAKGIQNIASTDIVNFAWNASDPDGMWDLSHHFILKEAEGFYEKPKVLVDTILKEAYFTYRKGFSPLTHYEWSVSVENNIGQKSEETIHGTLNTQGVPGENAIYGFVTHTSSNKALPIHLELRNDFDEVVYRADDYNMEKGAFVVKPIADGDYKITASIDGYTDFTPATQEISIRGNQVLTLKTMTLQDNYPPQILAFSGKDTIPCTDPLKFGIWDKGGDILSNRIKIAYESTSISNFTFKNDTLTAVIPEIKTNWTTKTLSVTAYDQSGNKKQKTLYIAPCTTLAEAYSE